MGEVVDRAAGADRFEVGDRIGIAWLRRTCGSCEFCRRGAENLCPWSKYTGWDADGGFAEYVVVPQDYAYALPTDRSPVELAPLLCAGIIGYRALNRSKLPPGGRLGIYGFGSSAHLTAQLAAAQGAEIFVMTRGEGNQALARELGVAYVGGAQDRPPVALDSAIVFAPAGEIVPFALQALKPGGTVAVAGIYLSDVPSLNYERDLFRERDCAVSPRTPAPTVRSCSGWPLVCPSYPGPRSCRSARSIGLWRILLTAGHRDRWWRT
ncbi:hypothetical protein GCM10009744_44180 [Kribbella alba]|uniref:alcohol dehydrogenase n=1 Tax=Kribbella alba TaxID=190197 RepID=A0ABN2FI32_9ACTN